MNYKYAPLAALCAVLIVYTSSLPGHSLLGNGSLSEQIVSNLAHIPAYALLTFLWLKAFDRKENKDGFLLVNALILIGLVIFAVSDEIHQSFVPGRTASFMDVGLDFVGIFCGLNTSKIFRQFKLFQEK